MTSKERPSPEIHTPETIQSIEQLESVIRELTPDQTITIRTAIDLPFEELPKKVRRGPQPVFIRLGNREHDIKIIQSKLSEYVQRNGAIPAESTLSITRHQTGYVLDVDASEIMQPEESELETESQYEILQHNKIFLGHSWDDFDLDQIISLYIALEGRSIDDIDIEFGSIIPREELASPDTMTIEGPNQTQKTDHGFNTTQSANFGDDIEHGFSTAEVILRSHENSYPSELTLDRSLQSDPENTEDIRLKQLWELASWLSRSDARDEYDEQREYHYIKPRDIDQFKDVFFTKKKIYDQRYGNDLENHQDNRKEFIKQTFDILDQLLAYGALKHSGKSAELRDDFRDAAAEVDPSYQEGREAVEHADQVKQEKLMKTMSERIADEQGRLVTTVTTGQGYTIAAIDLRGDGLEELGGAPSLVANELKQKLKCDADIVILEFDKHDIDRADEELGSKILITAVKNTKGKDIHLDALANRLAIYENEHGKLPSIETEQNQFGGHKNVIASGPSGSTLDREEVVAVFQDMLEYQHFDTFDSFKQAATELARSLGVEKYHIHTATVSRGKYHIPEYTLELLLSNGEKLTIYESDIELYDRIHAENRISDDAEQWIAGFTSSEYKEPSEIAQFRIERAHTLLERSLDQGNTQATLTALEEVDLAYIEQLDPNTLLSIVQLVSQQDHAIDRVYNTVPDIKRRAFELPSSLTPRQASYSFPYLPAKFDHATYGILPRLLEYVQPEVGDQEAVGNVLVSILKSEQYKKAHQETDEHAPEIHDHVLTQLLRYIADEHTDQHIAENILNSLITSYPADEMKHHWHEAVLYGGAQDFDAIKSRFPGHAAFDALYQTVKNKLPEKIDSLASVPKSYVKEIDRERLAPDANGYTNIAVLLTNPDATREQFLQHNMPIKMLEKTSGRGGNLYAIDGIHGEIGVKGFLDLSPDSKAVPEIITAAVGQVKTALEHDRQATVRIIAGRWPGMFAALMGAQLQKELGEDAKRVVLSSFNISQGGRSSHYQDMPLDIEEYSRE